MAKDNDRNEYDDKDNVSIVNESFKEEQDREAQEENADRTTGDNIKDNVVDTGFNEVKARGKQKVKDWLSGGEEGNVTPPGNTTPAGAPPANPSGAHTAQMAQGAQTVAPEAIVPEAVGTGATGTEAVGVGAGSFGTGAGEVIGVIVIIVLIIMALIGFVYYFVSMPGVLKGKIDSFVKESTKKVIETLWEGNSAELNAESIDVQTRVETLQYLQDMGIDVVGYGFVPGLKFESANTYEESRKESETDEELRENYIKNTLEKTSNNKKAGNIVGYYVNLIDSEYNLLGDDEGTDFLGDMDLGSMIIGSGAFEIGSQLGKQFGEELRKKMNPREDLIYYYLMANERAYVKKGSGLFGKIFKNTSGRWEGMLDIEEKAFDGMSVKVDRENNSLIITRNNGIGKSDDYVFSLDGWTGRFGMPLEFSLALHLATMSSGMVEELITNENLQTTVTIGMGETRCSVQLRFSVKDEEGNTRTLQLPYNDAENKPNRLLEKLQKNKQINKDDLSIEGLYIVYQVLGDTEQEDEDAEKDNKKSSLSKSDFNEILKEIGYDYFTKQRIDYLYEELKDQKIEDGSVVNYVKPFIKRVIKHWYKDLDFIGAYSESNSPIEADYPYDESIIGENASMVTVLTPISGGIITGTADQPLVVKGDLVLCDGKKVDSSRLSELKGVGDYNWGDGYRTTKKIFTQGYYYTFDGTAETARSVYYQEEMESGSLEGAELYAFGVNSGRIIDAKKVYGGRSAPVVGSQAGLTKSEIINESTGEFLGSFKSFESVNEVFNKDGIGVYSIGTSTKVSLGIDLDWYVIYIPKNSLNYISPVQKKWNGNYYSQSEVTKRVNLINEVWESAGIACKRTHLTFDTVADNEDEAVDASNAQIMANTGLAILKNTDTQDAEYIYRDLKEMLIELGYYTEAEFEYLDTDVLNWFIPDYMPEVWPQNSLEDFGSFAAVLYPAEASSSADSEDSDSSNDAETTEQADGEVSKEQQLINLGLSIDKSQGFSPDLDVVAPGDCRILSKDNNGVRIEFTSEEEPEIGILDGYTMDINGINMADGITMVDEEGNEVQISYENAISEKTLIKAGSIIGKTGTEKICVFMWNDRGEYLSNVEDYMAPEMGTVSGQSDSFSVTGTVLSEAEFVECCMNTLRAHNATTSDFSESNVKEFYRVCKRKGVNPEYAFVTAVLESGYMTAGEATSTHNYWGYGANNGTAVRSYGTMLETLELYCNTIVEYQDPTSENYRAIMEMYNERSTYIDPDMGECNPNGYGLPSTAQGIQSRYSWLGTHAMDGMGEGGKYYLDPDRHGGSAIIYKTHEEYVEKCLNKHDQTSETTVWEKAQYAAWQVQSKIERAKEIFGDRAGTAMY